MLVELSIRDFILIDRLDLSFNDGLTVLSGETGAGKSILLDALSLAIGGRGETGFIRHKKDQAVVTASFEIKNHEMLESFLKQIEVDFQEIEQDGLILRRVLKREGSSRAFLNDRPISVSALKEIGELLVEIQGQFDAHGLMRPSSHKQFLDLFANHPALLKVVGEKFLYWEKCKNRCEAAKLELKQSTEEQEFLEFSLNELEALSIKDNEEEELVQLRSSLINAERNIELINSSIGYLSGEKGAAIILSNVQRSLDRISIKIPSVVEAIDRAIVELNESENTLARIADEMNSDETRLEEIEVRLAEIRSLARKHGVPSTKLPKLAEEIRMKLKKIKSDDNTIQDLEKEVSDSKVAFQDLATELSESRKKHGKRLEKAVTSELPEMKLDKASFIVHSTTADESNWNIHGCDEIKFLISTNRGSTPGPLNKIASGGERSRLLLALRAALSTIDSVPTLIFDEVDAGVGGAVSSAVGKRLKKLGVNQQILVVTHSPQVAALGKHHWQISKSDEVEPKTTATQLAKDERVEEIGRMLSGEKITAEARLAAIKLMEE